MKTDVQSDANNRLYPVRYAFLADIDQFACLGHEFGLHVVRCPVKENRGGVRRRERMEKKGRAEAREWGPSWREAGRSIFRSLSQRSVQVYANVLRKLISHLCYDLGQQIYIRS